MNSLLRSALYMPASNPRAVAKGPTLDADCIILDLEDSVAPSAKATARAAAVDAFNTLDFGHRLKILRINPADTEWYADDAAAAAGCALDGVLLPKADTVAAIDDLAARLAPGVQLWAMLETPRAVLSAEAIAARSADIAAFTTLVIGNNDLQKAAGMRFQSERHLLLPWLMQFVAAASTYGMQLLDGVYNDFRDLDGLERECRESFDMGMAGKTVIHPTQLPVVNTVWTPAAEAIAEARRIVDAFADPAAAGAGALQIDGKMVERLHLEQAERLLARAEHIARRADGDSGSDSPTAGCSPS